MPEVWKQIPGYEGLYEVSNLGRVRSLGRIVDHGNSGKLTIKARLLKLNLDRYQYVFLSRFGRPVRFRVHTLVLTTFSGPCPEGMVCRHLNGDPVDNRWPENLVWGTPAENIQDEIRHGQTMRRNFKLTDEQVAQIRLLRGTMSQQKIADRFGVHQNTISLIFLGKIYVAAR